MKRGYVVLLGIMVFVLLAGFAVGQTQDDWFFLWLAVAGAILVRGLFASRAPRGKDVY